MPQRIEDTAVVSPLAALCREEGLGPPREGFFTAPDGARLRFAAWTTPALRRGTAVFLEGRTEFIEKNLETYQLLLAHGFDLWTLDWRGQGLSGREAGHRHKGHIDDFATYQGDLERFLEGTVGLERLDGEKVLLGHSMGGHVGLRFLHDHPGAFDRAAFSAPMVDLTFPDPVRPLVRGLCHLQCAIRPTVYALLRGGHRLSTADPLRASLDDYRRAYLKFALLTSDAARFRRIERILARTPELAVGGPTAGWVRAALASIDRLHARGYPEAITTPVLILGAGRDLIVSTTAQRRLARRLPDARFTEISGAAHELLVECDDLRHRALAELADFLGIALDLPPPDLSGRIKLRP